MSDILLVHGAWHGGWCWRRVATALEANGHRVLRPTLTGLGERRHLLSAEVDLETHVADLLGVIRYEELDEFVLVAHSLGGLQAVVTADRVPEKVGALVLLDATLPVVGKSALDLRNDAAVATPLPAHAGDSIPPLPAELFGLGGAEGEWLDSMLTPQPSAVMTQPARLTGAFQRIGVKHYHRALRYRAGYFDDSLARAAADPTWTTATHDLDHDMMLTDVGWTVAAIEVAARGGSAGDVG